MFQYLDELSLEEPKEVNCEQCEEYVGLDPGGALEYFLGGYVPPGTPNWHPVLEKISPNIDAPFRKGPIFYTPF